MYIFGWYESVNPGCEHTNLKPYFSAGTAGKTLLEYELYCEKYEACRFQLFV